MAKLMLIGKVAQVEILQDPEDEEVILAKCRMHTTVTGMLEPCNYVENFDTTDDPWQAAERHADGVQ